MVLEKKWLFSIRNGAEIRPGEKGRKSPETHRLINLLNCTTPLDRLWMKAKIFVLFSVILVKVFDRVWHRGLIAKLNHYGIFMRSVI